MEIFEFSRTPMSPISGLAMAAVMVRYGRLTLGRIPSDLCSPLMLQAKLIAFVRFWKMKPYKVASK